MTHRPLHQIASEISKDWKKPYVGATPYIHAMRTLSGLDSKYGLDSGKSIVIYFLANSSTWRGDTARRIKAELKQMAEVK